MPPPYMLRALDEPPAPELLDDHACTGLLARGQVARLAYTDESGPVIVPVNYCLYRGEPVFRLEAGSRIESCVRGEHVALEIDELDTDARSAVSVLVRGVAKVFWDGPVLERRGLMLLRPWPPGEHAVFYRMRRVTVTGRRVSSDLPSALWLG